MMRAIGIDPGTVSIDICGLDDGALVLDRSLPTAAALADPAALVALLECDGPPDCIAGPSGYGLPNTPAAEVTEEQLRLAYLAPPGERGGIGGLRALARALANSSLPVVFTPGVIHLPSVPAHRKVNRVDMGTADKVCAAALGIREQARRRRCAITDVSFVMLELGGAFTAAIAVNGGRIVDGVGGTGGPPGLRAAGALDGEVAFLAGEITKAVLFRGGAASIRGDEDVTPERFAERRTERERLAWDAYIEGAVKAVAAMTVSVPAPHEILLSGRLARVPAVRRSLAARLRGRAPVRVLTGFAAVAKQAAQGAALIADGLAGGAHHELVEALGIGDASGTALDHLYVVAPAAARRRLGIA
jgi:predicted butyrate kinase (DUF1464 family)